MDATVPEEIQRLLEGVRSLLIPLFLLRGENLMWGGFGGAFSVVFWGLPVLWDLSEPKADLGSVGPP